MRILFDVILQIILVALGLILALWYEAKADPILTLSKAETSHNVYPDARGTARFTHVSITNAGPSKLPFIGRRTAQATHGYIKFRYMNGTQLHTRSMPIRWSGQPEPVKYEIYDGQIIQLINPSLTRISRYMDIPPGETETIDIAVRREGNLLAFGWSHENYERGKWEHPEFEIPTGEYQVDITISTGDKKFERTFKLINPERFDRFDIAPLAR